MKQTKEPTSEQTTYFLIGTTGRPVIHWNEKDGRHFLPFDSISRCVNWCKERGINPIVIEPSYLEEGI